MGPCHCPVVGGSSSVEDGSLEQGNGDWYKDYSLIQNKTE